MSGNLVKPAPRRIVLAVLAWLLITCAFACFVILLAARLASAHGDADWINRGKYRSEAGELCCGKDDCYEVAPARVLQSRRGYELLDHAHRDGSPITIPYARAIPSEDGKYWICKAGSRMRCFFAPLTGF